MEVAWPLAVGDQEKESNPILKVVFSKIRNLRKKMTQIQLIKSFDQRALKPAQIQKLAKESEIVGEIERYQDFAREYKTILIENNLAYDKVDDLLKISTLLTVGKRVQAQNYCPAQVKNVYQKFYDKILGSGINAECKDLSDEVIRVYHLLWLFLENELNYSECRDYLSYVNEIDCRMATLKHDYYRIAPSSTPTLQPSPFLADLAKKIHKLKVESEIFAISLDKTLEIAAVVSPEQLPKAQKAATSQRDLEKQEDSTTNPERQSQEVLELADARVRPPSNVWAKKEEVSNEKMPADLRRNDSKAVSNNPNGSRTAKNRERRNRRRKRSEQSGFEFNIRKCSDTSLQPTPQKAWGKKKYMQKVERH